ncbi:MAG: flavin monoamine oxidase family protein [Pseudonocardiaceae bacterium]
MGGVDPGGAAATCGPGAPPRGRRITIAVLGAGIAGLVAGYELEQLGYDVVVLEADSRIGGRVFTRRFGGPDGPIAELGAMRIPAGHRFTMRYVDELGLRHRLRPFRNILSDPNNCLRVGSQLVRVGDAAASLIRETERYVGENSYRRDTLLFVGWLHAMVRALGPRELREFDRGDARKMLALADQLDMAPFLHDDRVSFDAAFRAYPELRVACTSRLESFLDDLIRESGTDMLTLTGGMAQLVDGFAYRIRGPIYTGREIAGLDVRRDGVSVHLAGAWSRSVKTYPIVLCTIPFSVLRGLPLTGVSTDKLDAIATLDYGSGTKVALHCREAFWIRDGITGGGSAPGGLSRQIYYPDVGADDSSVLLGSYTIAEDADVLGQLSEPARHAAVADELAELHPQLRQPETVLETMSVAWGERRWHKGCVARRWGVTDEERARAAQRAACPQGRLFFAGEHCSINPAWINAGIESALHAVAQIDTFARRLVGGWSQVEESM